MYNGRSIDIAKISLLTVATQANHFGELQATLSYMTCRRPGPKEYGTGFCQVHGARLALGGPCIPKKKHVSYYTQRLHGCHDVQMKDAYGK